MYNLYPWTFEAYMHQTSLVWKNLISNYFSVILHKLYHFVLICISPVLFSKLIPHNMYQVQVYLDLKYCDRSIQHLNSNTKKFPTFFWSSWWCFAPCSICRWWVCPNTPSIHLGGIATKSSKCHLKTAVYQMLFIENKYHFVHAIITLIFSIFITFSS